MVTQITPGISLTGTGPRLKVKARYAMQNLFYLEDSRRNAINHMLSANANTELIEDLFFMDGQAAISQQNTTLSGQQTTDNTNVTGNRAEVRTYSLSPYLRHRFSTVASSELRYTHSGASTDIGALSNSQTDRINLQLNSGASFKTLGWGLNYSKQKISYGSTTNTLVKDLNNETFSGNLRYMLTPRFGLTATGGYEKNDYISIGAKPEGSFWSGGFSWAPTSLTSIDASAGKRFFGNTYSLAARHHTRLTAWTLAYKEDITSTQFQFLVPAQLLIDPTTNQPFRDPATGLPVVQSDAVNFFTNRLFLQKSLRASVALQGVRNNLIFSLFSVSREAQTTQAADSALLGTSNLALSDKTKQVGGNAIWNLRLGPRTSTYLNAGYARNTYPVLGRTDNDKNLRLGLTRQFQPKLSGAVELRRLQRDSSQSGSDYRENAITASVHMIF
ncbi:hypothetical protein SKTS_14860 [Sulfurimicrobium lacus]|uniref:TIGR03016 family PEP-CTERM system-associated outer membrane protein n=1 Tax=Sulfurimicrobium lacus TaxID=2715678 RepID=A0A6F8VB92_9PROT|nr:hypothetical protein SKTS_14860 [Sulfurimicrobium lacus]